MITLRCLNCGLTVLYEGSEADFCPRCLARAQQAVQLIPISDRPSAASERSIGRLSITTSVSGGRHLVALGGELDIGSAAALEATLAEACAAGATEIVLEMGGSSRLCAGTRRMCCRWTPWLTAIGSHYLLGVTF